MTVSHPSRRLSIPAAFVASLVVLLLSAPVASAAVEQRSLDRAHKFLKDPEVGKQVLSFVHFGAEYRRHTYMDVRRVKDAKGAIVADKFVLVYRYEWDEDGTTDLAFLCDWRGNVYKIDVLKHNAIIQQPFAMADLTIKLLGNVVLGAFGDGMTAKDRLELRRLIDAADSRGLLLAYVKLAQALR